MKTLMMPLKQNMNTVKLFLEIAAGEVKNEDKILKKANTELKNSL